MLLSLLIVNSKCRSRVLYNVDDYSPMPRMEALESVDLQLFFCSSVRICRICSVNV